MNKIDFNNPKIYYIKSVTKTISIDDNDIYFLGHGLGGFSVGIIELSESQGLNHLFTLHDHTSSSLANIRWFLDENFLLPMQLIQEHDGMVYIYICDRKEITDVIEKFMKMSCYSLKSKRYIPEVIKDERWIEYKFKALYPIEKIEFPSECII